MEFVDVVKEVKQYFKIQELVSEPVYRKYGEAKCWSLFRQEILETLIVIRRDILKVGLVCNDWCFGGTHHQRGWRENVCQICKDKTKNGIIYASAHVLGCAFDLVSAKMTAEQMRRLIVEHAYMLPYPIRIEEGVSWLHIDTCINVDMAQRKITIFRN